MGNSLTDTTLMPLAQRAVDLAIEHVKRGGIPFSALVIGTDGSVLGSGVNEVAEDNDALAHAEIVAMRAVAKTSNRFRLHRATLIASGEPCALCYHAVLYFGVTEVIVIASRDDAAQYGFDYTDSYRIFAVDPAQWPYINVRRISLASGLEPFQLWRLHNTP